MSRFSGDSVMQALEARVGAYALVRCVDPWEALASAVVFQQVSGRAAAGVCAKMRASLGRFPTPADVLAAPSGTWKAFGMTERKEETLRALADAIVRGRLDLASLAEKHESVLMGVLTQFKGVGRWTVEMWMVFHLGRDDVFMPGDLGLRKAIAHHYGLSAAPTPEEASRFAERWKPYRTIASWYLWKSLPGFPEPGFGAGEEVSVVSPGSRLGRLGAAAIQWHQDRDDVALDALKDAAAEFATSEEADAQ